MWRGDDCFTYVYYYCIHRSDVSVISFKMCQSFLSGCVFFAFSFALFFFLNSTMAFDLIIMDFGLSLPVGSFF